MAWVYLLLAGLCEVGFTTCLKLSDGLTRLWPSVGFAVLLTASMGLLTVAARDIPLGTAYAVWVGIGAALTVGWAMATGVEPFSLLKVLFIAGIVGCAAGLKSLPADVTSAADRSETRVPA
jgi:quaternary ammonium compound-resistance protein SugE